MGAQELAQQRNHAEVTPLHLLAALLARLLSDRQIRLPRGLQAWLLPRLPRDPGALQAAVSRLDKAIMAIGGGVTRNLAREVRLVMCE